MKWAIVALNPAAIQVALNISNAMTVRHENQSTSSQSSVSKSSDDNVIDQVAIYTLPKHIKDGLLAIDGKLVDFTGVLFREYDVIIYCMAMGIVVRSIVPYIQHKSQDPAVICVSVDGKYAIPVLSGHLGGANESAVKIASGIGATAVVTTASDLLDVTAVDMIAKVNDLIIDSYEAAKDVTALIVDGKKVGLLSDIALNTDDINGIEIISNFGLRESVELNGYDGLVYVGYHRLSEHDARLALAAGNMSEFNMPQIDRSCVVARLIPKNLVLGIGARRDTPYETIREQLDTVLTLYHIDIRAIAAMASIDLKADEKGILALAEALDVPFETYTAETLKSVDDRFEGSEFVRKVTGVGSVAMSSGYMASNQGNCVVEKVAGNGVTVCLFEKG